MESIKGALGSCPQHFTLRNLCRHCPECSLCPWPVRKREGRGGRGCAGQGPGIPVYLGESELSSYLDVGVEGWLFGIHLAGMTLTLLGHACVPVSVCVCVCVCVCVYRCAHRGDGGKPFSWKRQNLSFLAQMWEVTTRAALCSWHLTSGSLCSFKLRTVWFFCTYTWYFS